MRHTLNSSMVPDVFSLVAAMLLTVGPTFAQEQRTPQPARKSEPAKSALPTSVAQWLPAMGKMNMFGNLPQIFWDKLLPVAIEAFAKSQSGALSDNEATLLSGNRTLSDNKAISDNKTLSGNKMLSGNRPKVLSENDTRALNGNRMSLFSDIKVEINVTIHQHGNPPPPAPAPEKKPQGR